MKELDTSHLLERIKSFEDRCAVRLEALGAEVEVIGDQSWLTVRGELHAQSGEHIHEDIELEVAAYDSNSRIIGTGTYSFDESGFFCFAVFEICIQIRDTALSRIRIYPKR